MSKHKHSPPLWCYKSSSVPLVFDYRPRTPVPALLCTQNKLITDSHTVSVNNPKTMQIPSFTHSTQPLTHYPVPKMCFHGQISCWILDQLDFFQCPTDGCESHSGSCDSLCFNCRFSAGLAHLQSVLYSDHKIVRETTIFDS